MCVIFVVEKQRPPDDMVEGAFRANGDGAGIAWRDGGKVRFKKGLELPEIKDLCASVPMPYVAHFRIRSVGDAVEELTHPFLINPHSPLILSGTTKDHVLFHNGHWGKWKDTLIAIAAQTNTKLPTGKWSDSRAMAWIASVLGLGYLELLDEKVVAFGPGQEDLEVFGQWIWAEKEQMWVSNKSYEHARTRWSSTSPYKAGGSYHTTPPASMMSGNTNRSNEQTAGGSAPQATFPPSNRQVEGEGSALQEQQVVQVSVEEGPQTIREGLRPGVPGSTEIREATKGLSSSHREVSDQTDHTLEREISTWARSINKKPLRSSGVVDQYTRRGCHCCGKYEALQAANLIWYCSTCQSKLDNAKARVQADPGCDRCGKYEGLRPAGSTIWHCAECKAIIVNEAQMGRAHQQHLNDQGIQKMIC